MHRKGAAMHATTTTCDVLVVGAGPSGLTTAAALTRAGLRVLIVEKHPSLSVFPKATGLRPRTMEILRTWGLEKAVLARSARTTLSMRVSPTLGIPGQEVGLGLPSPEALAEVSPTTIALCAQDRLEEILLAEVRAHRGACRFSTELIDIQQEEHAIWAITRSRIDGSTGAVRARYLVGADGARSTVRDLLGIRFVDLGSEGNHLGTLFRADLS